MFPRAPNLFFSYSVCSLKHNDYSVIDEHLVLHFIPMTIILESLCSTQWITSLQLTVVYITNTTLQITFLPDQGQPVFQDITTSAQGTKINPTAVNALMIGTVF